MSNAIKTIGILMAFVLFQPAMAETFLSPTECSFWCHRKAEAISPVTTDGHYPLYIGTGLTLGLLIFEDQIVDPTEEEVVEHKPLGRFSKIGDWGGRLIPNAAYVVGMLFDVWISGSSKSLQRADVMFKATAYAGLTTVILKKLAREPRPYSGSDRTSFPSGHTTTAFAFAAAVTEMHGWAWGAPAYSLATFVAFSRINDNKHFLHDVVAGATIGTAYGIGIAQIEGQSHSLTTRNSAFFVLPTGDMSGLQASYALSF
jgi:hypothetical protein